MAALCQMFGRSPSLHVDWLVKPDESERTTKTEIFTRSGPKRGKSACGERLALISTGGQSFGTKRPNILTTHTQRSMFQAKRIQSFRLSTKMKRRTHCHDLLPQSDSLPKKSAKRCI